ncbi:uncharacterized protein IWZ02DRAFT_140879 [Phyllosticta citriasiana]|uniref:uncharacterized protein n=1 Tax=Phyllosticta citriasiana TaxID=595635 RepID=UPI0030FD7046
MTETHASSFFDVDKNVSASSSSYSSSSFSSPRPSLIVPPFVHFNFSPPAASTSAAPSDAATFLVNANSTQSPCASSNATAAYPPGCSPILSPPYPQIALPRPSYAPFLNSSAPAITLTSGATDQGPTPLTPSLVTSTAIFNPSTTTLVVPAAPAEAAGGVAETSMGALILVVVVMVVFM